MKIKKTDKSQHYTGGSNFHDTQTQTQKSTTNKLEKHDFSYTKIKNSRNHIKNV